MSTCILSILLVCVAFASYGCSTAVELPSAWRARDVVVDGSDSDWQGATTYIKGPNLALGVRNDSEYLYACVILNNRQTQMQVLASGLTVWFDAGGGQNKSFGFRFPLGVQGNQLPAGVERSDEPEDARQLIQQSQSELEVIGPGKDDRERLPSMVAQGITAKLGNRQGVLVYELRVPLRKSARNPYAIDVGEAQFLGIGFETSGLNPEMMKDRPGGTGGGGMGRGGPPPGGGGMPPGGGGMPPGGGPPGMQRGGPPEPLKLWTRVQLALSIASGPK